MDGFVHLHVHSHYSLLDGGSTIKALVGQAKALGMNALALTDHGNLYGAIDFYEACKAADVKPIIGIEAYISPTTRTDRSFSRMQDASNHLVLLAANETGFRNLLKLSSRAFLEGFYYRPRIDRELLGQFNEGLICTSACLSGAIPRALLAGNGRKAEEVARQYLEIFGPERFFIEVQNQGLDDQTRVNPLLAALAERLDVGLVGSNDVHFLTREHKPSHEVLCCISTGKTIGEGTMHEAYPPELYLKSPEEMRRALARWPAAADNTLGIAERCNLELDFTAKHLPVFPTPNAEPAGEYLAQVARDALARRFGGEPPEEYARRLERELKVIDEKGYSSYFLIVYDFVRYARGRGIPCGARGSGCATLLGYCLDLSNVDPIRFGLLFERFTDPQREEDPDVDIDICQKGRAEVIDYVRRKYGHVAQIITYGTLKAKAAIRDVGRVMDIPLAEVDQICKKVPDGLKVTIDSSLEAEPELKRLYDTDNRIRTLIDHARNLEGLARHAGVHAAGVVVADKPLEDVIPLARQADSDEPITQWDGPTVDKVGLMKMDFLGLRTLTIIQHARDLVKADTGVDMDPDAIDQTDQEVFDLFRRGRTCGVFQFESGGMRDLLQKLAPSKIEELIAASAMYRPGPMELIPSYIARKHGREDIPSVHPLVDDILAETYGVMCYQEQVMQVVNRLGKLPLNTALTLIKAISKKKHKVIAAERANFIGGAIENGISESEAERLFALIEKFAGYGFNKAHSTAYAIVAYQSAYFKAHYPKQFMASTLTYEAGDSDKLSEYLDECSALGISVGPPDINTSAADFTVVGEGIRFGLAAVKGVGHKAVEAILEARGATGGFDDLYHFCEHVDLRAVNRATIEALIKCGAFDGLGAHRAAAIAAVDGAIDLGQGAAADRRSGQMNLFGAFAAGEPAAEAGPSFPAVQPWTEAQLLAAEKQTLGFYITSHPLTSYGRELTNLSSTALADLPDLPEGAAVIVGCMIAQVRPTLVKKGRSAGQKMAMLTVEDLTGQADCVVFSDAYNKVAEHLLPETMVFLQGTVDRRREAPSIIIDEVIPMADAVEALTAQVLLRLDKVIDDPSAMADLRNMLTQFKGRCLLYLQVRPPTAGHLSATVRADPQWYVAPRRALLDRLETLLGEANVVFRGKPAGNNGRNGGNRRNGGRRRRAGTSAGPAAGNGVASPAVTRFN